MQILEKFRRFWRSPTPVAPQTQAQDVSPVKQRLLDLGADRHDFLQILQENPFAPELRALAAEVLLERYIDDLTLEELDLIVVHTANTPTGEAAGKRILRRATHKDQLARVLLSIPSLRVEAAQRTLAQDPEPHDLLRCLAIPEVQDEALERWLRSMPPRDTLLHVLRFGQRNYPAYGKIESAVKKHIETHGLRIDLTPAMYAAVAPAHSGALH